MGVAEVTGLVVRPAITGGMRARKAKSRQDHVTKRQIAGFVAVAVLTTVLTRVLNDLVEQHLGDE